MQAVTEAYESALASDVVELYRFINVFETIGGSKIAGPILVIDSSGEVVCDQTALIRRTFTNVQCVSTDSKLIPSDPTTPLWPDGAEAQLWHGVMYPDGSTEVKSLGVFLLTDVVADLGADPGAVVITMSGTDHGGRIQRALFTQPYATDGVSDVGTAIQDVITTVLPNVTFQYNFSPSSFVPAVANANVGDDPWQFCCTLASGAGMELFADPFGVITLQPVVDPSTLPVVRQFVQGPNCVVNELKHTLSNDSVPNWVIVISQGSGVATPLRADWQDTDPSSYTYIGELSNGPGSYPVAGTGNYPLTIQYVTTSLCTTQDQAQAMANAIGLAGKGLFDGIIMYIPTDASLDANDVIAVTFARAGVVGPRTYVIDTWNYSMGNSQFAYGTGRRVS